MREQRRDELLLLDAARSRLEHQAHRRVLARFVAHRVEHGEQRGLQLQLIAAQGLLADLDLRVRQLLDFFEHLLRAGARRQFIDDQLPLAARQVFDLPACPHLQAAAAARVGGANFVGAADDLAAARVIGPRHQRRDVVVAELVVLQQGDRCGRHFAQVVARHFGREADRDAARAVEQHERQPCRQQLGLLRRAVVVRHEVNGALVDLIEQQARDRREARFGVAHRCRAVAVARAEVAMPIDQRIALRKALRHSHQRVVSGLVAVRVKLAEHVADDSRAWRRHCRRNSSPFAASRTGCAAGRAFDRRRRRAARGPSPRSARIRGRPARRSGRA